jgi:transcriptional regulator with XRE-family HTH domain
MSEDGPSKTQAFGDYVAEAVRAAGFNIDSPRGGGVTALAEETGMSHASVSRMLAGKTIPDPNFLEALAGVLGLPLTELLVRSGIVSRNSIPGGGEAVLPPLTPAVAARRLGITNPLRVALFEAMVATLTDPAVGRDN